MSTAAFKETFIARVKQARKEARFSQIEIAALLGIAQDTYKMYETRSCLPHYLIPRFCIACRIDVAELYGMTKSNRR
jgi:transcriptional regulator with XRE-family HTH domain